jgi:hypothetical protein
MAIQKKSLIGTSAAKPKEADGDSGKRPGAKRVDPEKVAAARKLAVAKVATAKLATARLTFLRKLDG